MFRNRDRKIFFEWMGRKFLGKIWDREFLVSDFLWNGICGFRVVSC